MYIDTSHITRGGKTFYVAAVVKPSYVFFFPAFSGRCVTSPQAVWRLPGALAPHASNGLLTLYNQLFTQPSSRLDGLHGITNTVALHGVLTAQRKG